MTPVILLEGTRIVPSSAEAALTALGRFLARQFPHARFRSGNAEGSDTLFARGVEAVDPARMELIIPTAGHRRKTGHTIRVCAQQGIPVVLQDVWMQ